MDEALVIGGGPAGLMAAGELATAGLRVVVAEAKPTVGRKFLMAGKSGLNLTKDENLAELLPRYGAAARHLRAIITAFDSKAVQNWARGLGQEVFIGSSGRVFPTAMKASPLLRAWVRHLGAQGVEFRTGWRWTGWDGAGFRFETPDGGQVLRPKIAVLALGGASWSRLGSDGSWADLLAGRGVSLAPFRPVNMGFLVNWSPHMAQYFGAPVKGVALLAGCEAVRGEFVVSARGVEGGGIYAVAAVVRDGAEMRVDLLPDWSLDKVTERLGRPRGKTSISNHLRKVLRLDPVKIALMQEFARPLPQGRALAGLIKSLPIHHAGPRPLDEAISVAGGVRFDGLNGGLMLTALPGVFCAGEMLDWEAPTGGYLLNACFATGRWAGRAAAEFAENLPR